MINLPKWIAFPAEKFLDIPFRVRAGIGAGLLILVVLLMVG